MRTIHHFIGGKEVPGISGRFADVFNPATGEIQAKVALASDAEVDAAVKTAQGAFPGWANTPPLTRARVRRKSGSEWDYCCSPPWIHGTTPYEAG